jgi:hypothetical protein
MTVHYPGWYRSLPKKRVRVKKGLQIPKDEEKV